MDNKCTKIILIRHGESLANAKRIYLGHTDWDLSELGKAQAVAAAEAMRDVKIDKIYSSDLIRAYNTAYPHAKMRSLEVEGRAGLREIYLGEWECRKIEELENEYPDEFCVGWRQNFGTCRVPGGESVPQVGERIYKEIVKIGEENLGKTVLIGCHAAAIRAFWARVTNTAPEDVAQTIPFPKNASITTVIYDGGVLIPIKYGDDTYQIFDTGAAEA